MNPLRRTLRRIVPILLLAFIALCGEAKAQSENPPPNAPASIEYKDSSLKIDYNGRTIFTARVSSNGAPVHFRTESYKEGSAVQQIALLTTMDWQKKIRITGTVEASDESFPCESDRPTDRASQGPLIVRNTSGIGLNLRNRAVYDRHGDWVISVDANPKVIVTPVSIGATGNLFQLDVEGFEIVLRFRPRFYQQHRGLKFFEPWNYRVWTGSVAGWISWFAFFDKVSEKDMMETADVFSSALHPYGYEYFQMDDGYQQGNGGPDKWLKPNEKFPHGLKYLADYIRSRGLKPGLWMGVGIFDETLPKQHPEWFVRDESGTPVQGNWIGYPLDASNDEALRNVVRPIFHGFRGQGWEYFKVDGLRHLRYEGYNANKSYFERKKLDLVASYRRYALAVREELGKDHFMLGCWGIRPELVGIIDGCRIGDDGFAYAGLAQYNSFNNIVWRNDPDHIELTKDGYRSTMVTSLTGSVLMLTDKPSVYATGAIEPAKRAAPVLFTRPAQLYDVDPSRSALIDRVNAEVSGSGPRPFDAGYTPLCFLYSLEVYRPYGNWCLLGRTGGEFPQIRFADLGLPADRDYLVFEYWSKSLMGSFVGSFNPGRIDTAYKCQLFCIREQENHPQLLATNRHISCGGLELKALRWEGRRLRGTSDILAKEPYTIYLLEPDGFQYKNTTCDGANVVSSVKHGLVREITIEAAASATVTWTIEY